MTKKQTEERWPEPVYLTADHAINMPLRDYFAAKAMQGMMADGQVMKLVGDLDLAKTAYEMADAMLKARGQT